MAVVLSASVPTLASDPTRPDPGPQAASIRGMSCVGEEPFWGLEIGRTEARLSRPGAAGIDEIILTGRLDTLDFLEPPAAVFRGEAALPVEQGHLLRDGPRVGQHLFGDLEARVEFTPWR